MQGSNALHLARSKSNGVEKRPPPPIRPKPTALSSPPTSEPSTASSSSTSVSALASAFQQNRSITTADKSTPASFGDLRKAFESNANSNPLFNEQRSSSNARSPLTLQSQQGSSLHVPAPSSNRPRSVSSPAPPHHEPKKPSSESSGVEGIDNSQPDFGNLRARFQSQASLSNISLSKPVRLRAQIESTCDCH